MRSYIKIYGPPISKAIKNLERLSIDIPEVSIMNKSIHMRVHEATREVAKELSATPLGSYAMMAEFAMTYFDKSGSPLPRERSSSVISRSGETLGEYDFFFEWIQRPDQEQVNKLIKEIDEVFAHLGCFYTITTK